MYNDAIKAQFDLFTYYFSFIFIYYDIKPMISLHIPYLEKQPIKTSDLFLNMVRMLILILQIKYDRFCWNMVKNRFYYKRNHIGAYIFKVWVFCNIVIDSSSPRVDSSVIHETRVGTLMTRGSNNNYPSEHNLHNVLKTTLNPNISSQIRILYNWVDVNEDGLIWLIRT